MKSQNTKKSNKKIRNYEKAAIIQFELKKRGLKQKDIAVSLDISEQTVYGVLHGVSTSRRVGDWIYKNLGVRV